MEIFFSTQDKEDREREKEPDVTPVFTKRISDWFYFQFVEKKCYKFFPLEPPEGPRETVEQRLLSIVQK